MVQHSLQRHSRSRWRKLCSEQCGSFTLDATITVPIVILLTFALLFFVIHHYRIVDVQQRVAKAAVAVADEWLCCSDTWKEGGLYRRWTQGGVLGWLYKDRRVDGVHISFPAHLLPSSMKGEIVHRSGWLEQYIEARLADEQVQVLPYTSVRQYKAGESRSLIVDAAEWIRNIDLLRVYGTELKERSVSKTQAKQSIDRFLQLNAPITFAVHGDAAKYLRQLVAGQEVKLTVPNMREKRLIDALTAEGVAHSAYLTFTEKQIRTQMEKDVALLREGTQISGVVWHFFRKTNQKGKVGPSDPLLQDLKKHGIVVVIHDEG